MILPIGLDPRLPLATFLEETVEVRERCEAMLLGLVFEAFAPSLPEPGTQGQAFAFGHVSERAAIPVVEEDLNSVGQARHDVMIIHLRMFTT